LNKVTKRQFANSAGWKMLETFTSKFMAFFISIILARLLMPEDYGIIAITSVFLSFTDIFIQGGFNIALISKEKVDNEDYSTVLIFSTAMAVGLYIVLYFSAPLIAAYYKKEILKYVLRIIGIVLFLQAFSSVRVAKMTRDMEFKLLAKLTLFACLISGIIGIIAAYLGMGVWALVMQQIFQQAILNILMFIKLDFRFKLKWSSNKFREMFSFSFFVFLSAFIYYLGDNITNIIVGKVYSVETLGFLSKGDQIPRQISVYIFSALSSVLLPTFASRQNDPIELKKITRKIVRMSSFVIMPMMFGLCASSEPLIIVLFSEKWFPSVEIQKWSSIYYLTYPITAIFTQLLYSLKKSNNRVMLEIIRLFLMLLALYITINIITWNINELMMCRVIVSIVVMLISTLMVAKLINYNLKEAVKDIAPYFIGAIIMGVIVYFINYLAISYIIKFIIQVILGMSVYIIISTLLEWNELDDILTFLKTILKGKNVLNNVKNID